MNQIELKALAKINLGLDVLGKRENGYHDVRMIMQSIYLYDEVKIEKKDTPEIEVVSNLNFLPTGEDNIAYKAARLLQEEFKISDGVQSLVGRLKVTPAFIIAKGGITSSDVATRGLSLRRATVMGQILPGIPVWRTGTESKFPGMPYVIFPGNVGDEDSLLKAVEKLSPAPVEKS